MKGREELLGKRMRRAERALVVEREGSSGSGGILGFCTLLVVGEA